MRINISAPRGGSGSCSTSDLSHLPAPLARLAPSGELVLIELQGSLEIDEHEADVAGGQILADLQFHPGRLDRPTLLISHHRLEGKIVSLAKPFAVLQKKRRTADSKVMQALDANRITAGSSTPARRAPPRPDEHDEEENGDFAPASPTEARKRARTTETKDSEGHVASQRLNHQVPSSSPVAPVRTLNSDFDYSSPVRRNHFDDDDTEREQRESVVDGDADEGNEEDDWLHKPDTAVYMDVVCIIRKKILFTKRPEPVVRLE